MIHLKIWFNLERKPQCSGPSWHWVAWTAKFCASRSLLVFRNFLMLLQPAFHFSPLIPLSSAQRLPSFLASVLSPTISTWWPCTWEKAAWSFWLHSVSKNPRFLCLHPTNSSSSFPAAHLSWVEIVFISPEILTWMVCHCLPLKILLPLFK